jgi:opacity protein-like surface antigen
MKWHVIVALVAGLAVAQAADAQSAGRAGTWETDVGAVFQNSANVDFEGGTTADLDSGVGFQLGIGYHLTDNLLVSGNFNFNSIDYKAKIAGDQVGEVFQAKGSLDNFGFMLDGTWNFLDGPFSPFVSAGIGYSWVDTNLATEPPQVGCWWDPWYGYVCANFQDTKTIDGFAYEAAVGARYDFNSSFALLGSYRMMWIDLGNAKGTPDFDGFTLSLGWKF